MDRPVLPTSTHDIDGGALVKRPVRRRAGLALAASALVIALLVSCAVRDDAEAPAAGPVGVQVAETLAVSTGETIAVEDVGRLPAGQRAYVLPDATRVVVATAEPLPRAVRASVQGQVDHVIQDPGVPGRITTNRSLIVDTAQGIANRVGVQTGKRIVFVYPLIGGCPASSEPYRGWAHTAVTLYDTFPCDVLPTREEAEARVAETVAAQPDPERYEVFVHQE